MRLISQPLTKLGLWTQNHLVVFENFAKSFKDVITKGKERLVNGAQNHVLPTSEIHPLKQNFTLLWKPQLQKFQSSLKGNATKMRLQLSYRNSMGSKSFRNDLLWRQARKGHLIAFAGLFLFQEESQKSMEKLQHEFQIYESVGKNIKNIFPEYKDHFSLPDESGHQLKDYVLESVASKNNNGVIYNAKLKSDKESNDFDSLNTNCSWDVIDSSDKEELVQQQKCDFLVKAVTPANGATEIKTIIKDRENELLCCGVSSGSDFMISTDSYPTPALPSHPNIIKFYRAFSDHVDFSDRLKTSPNCRPPPKTLYLVSKRYDLTLRTYLEQNRLTSEEVALIFLQLLEAVAHLEVNNAAHRNISVDNIYVDFDRNNFPRLVLSGFEDSYVAASPKDIKIPFQHPSLDTRLKHLSSQAPEVSCAVPGRFCSVDYSKSDVWSVGCVAYKILTGRNPFTDSDSDGIVLDSRTYKEKDLPSLSNIPVNDVLKAVVEMLLTRNSKKRLSAAEAANILHLELFALPPCGPIEDDMKCRELTNWMTFHSAEALARNRSHSVPFYLCQSFFNRFDSLCFSRQFQLWMFSKYFSSSPY